MKEYLGTNGSSDSSAVYKYGTTGSMVSFIQEALTELGYYGAQITGHYGGKTEDAVRNFQRDNGDKLYPSDKTRVPGYRPADDGTKQRAIIWFSLLNETVPGYRYNIALYAVEEIYTGTSEVVEDAARLEELGDARTGYTLGTFNLSREWLTSSTWWCCTMTAATPGVTTGDTTCRST